MELLNIKNKISEIKNRLDGIKSRLNIGENNKKSGVRGVGMGGWAEHRFLGQ